MSGGIVRWLDRSRGGHPVEQQWRYSGSPDTIWGFDQIGWFGARKFGRNSWMYVAPDGSTHDTLRDLFSGFRLRMCRCDRTTDAMELLRIRLHLIKSGIHVTDRPGMLALAYAGDAGYFEDYAHWLELEHLLDCEGTSLDELRLTKEGSAALNMLDATAPGSNQDMSPRAASERGNRVLMSR